ncbi:ABC transporter permease [Clostridium estertheticum]|uniref:ABC transporter permease n=1 Tax=Clostridium estertheticum TaxID=238834 RepID=UPI001C0A948B|nr:ABC transporter permease [Clostridium estertheticum]MBU3218068.1 ABC transporter permease [Clostridium estertheticum]MCB2306992.1 ABC transporter permease [Clostridium estertheticum]MCB2345800.1 ABC transporter permease [Clostridium estertheticum]MCB2350608.1 ABC transporter permease [Clostridium estertheticum]WAG45513.1 ABC transporter permease [Clostridium estertheticum]
MLKLIKLEIKKFKLNKNVKTVMIINLIILAVLLLGVYSLKFNTKENMFRNYSDVFLYTGTIVRATFSIFAAALISKLIIGEYKCKTINIMFSYPIKRKKIMAAKLAIVVIFAFTTMILSNIFLIFSIYLLNIFANFIQIPLTQDILVKNLINIFVYSATFSFVSLIPLYIGMRNKSGSATIITSIIVVSLLNSGSNGDTLSSIIIIPIILAIIGIFVAYLSIKDIEKVDVTTP